jgi:SAM-dependent methyltransferase
MGSQPVASDHGRQFGSYGEHDRPTVRVAIRDWLVLGSLLRKGAPYAGKRVADIGCGYRAESSRRLRKAAKSAVLVDLSVEPSLKADDRVDVIEGALPQAMSRIPDRSIDLLMCSAVLEHLSDPLETIRHFHRVLASDGLALISVPSWTAKRPLEFAAFRLGMSTDEMNDHKMYYDPRDLWPLLIKAGFRPQDVRCKKHWLRVNTLALCRQHLE